jgi:hypothetical protein
MSLSEKEEISCLMGQRRKTVRAIEPMIGVGLPGKKVIEVSHGVVGSSGVQTFFALRG